jgi:hypothetical protein
MGSIHPCQLACTNDRRCKGFHYRELGICYLQFASCQEKELKDIDNRYIQFSKDEVIILVLLASINTQILPQSTLRVPIGVFSELINIQSLLI